MPVGCDRVRLQTVVNERGVAPSSAIESAAAAVAVVAARVEPAAERDSVAVVLRNPQRLEGRQGAAVEFAWCRSSRPNRRAGYAQPTLGDDVAVVQDRDGSEVHHRRRLPIRFHPGSWDSWPVVA